MMALRPLPPLKFRQKAEEESLEKKKTEKPPEPFDVEIEMMHGPLGPPPSLDTKLRLGHQPLSTPGSRPVDLEATAYKAKGKATDFGEEFRVSSFLVPHSSAYTKTYILIDIFWLIDDSEDSE